MDFVLSLLLLVDLSVLVGEMDFVDLDPLVVDVELVFAGFGIPMQIDPI
jgi:hypothetical protein